MQSSDENIPILGDAREEAMVGKAAGKSWLSTEAVLGVLYFMSVWVIEIYGAYMLATVHPSTEKNEICPIFAMVIAQVCALAAVPLLTYALYSMDSEWGDWLSIAFACIASWSAFIASVVVISNKANSECAAEMTGSLISFMILDFGFGVWSAIGWLNVKPPSQSL